MDLANLAEVLINANETERESLLAQHIELADVQLAWTLKLLYDNLESADPGRAAQASLALASLAKVTADPEVSAIAAWTEGMVALDDGQLEAAITRLDHSEAQFLSLGQSVVAASTQISKFRALAIQGQYEEALQCGWRAREVFLMHNNMLATGKIEQSLGNLHFLLDQYVRAEQHYRAARELYEKAGDQKQLTQIDNCLATTLTSQHRFREAEMIYDRALAGAESAGLETTLAEIETNQGCLALFQGNYDRALDYLERARRRYAALGSVHNLAIADQEIADAYLELNLVPEAAAIYERVIPIFSDLGMQAELARALAYHARTNMALGRFHEARRLLAEARASYETVGNPVGKAMVTLIEAQAHFAEGNFSTAAAAASETEAPFADVHAWGRLLVARWLQGESARAQGKFQEAKMLLSSTLDEAEQWSALPVIQHCHTSFGLLAEAVGDRSGAEAAFRRAIASIEEVRAPLPAEEFRTAFLANKLIPYTEMVRLCLLDGNPRRVAEALDYIERARSRALMDMLGGVTPVSTTPRDGFEAGLYARLEALREELNWFYSQANLPDSDIYSRAQETMSEFYADIRERETAISEITLQLRQRNPGTSTQTESFDLTALSKALGEQTALVEYFSLDGRLLALVVTELGIETVDLSAMEEDVETVLRQFQFQLGALRHGAKSLHDYLPKLTERARHHLCKLYDLLMKPIEGHLGSRRLVVVPHRVLHYVPFHALYDGSSYLIERREVCCVPSAAVLQHCLSAPRNPLERATLLGFADERNPRVREEVLALARAFPETKTLLGDQASRASLSEHASASHVLHLACHGNFRLDNPLFSSLQLADGWLTVRDVYQLNLASCELVTLSACETGVNVLAPGDEWIGLARGFFSAGSPSLLVSQWVVDDEATARLMIDFYSHLRMGAGPAAALRYAQCQLLKEKPHPYFWAPFVILGRW
ncbi:MAG TPA: CHAT domain-containing protein [Anaerolineales bacterium]|nr:CHAT domain-containing protein [Anaerolineales bacterium]